MDGKVKPVVLMNLGRVDQLDMDGLRAWRHRSPDISAGTGAALPADAEAGVAAGAPPKRATE